MSKRDPFRPAGVTNLPPVELAHPPPEKPPFDENAPLVIPAARKPTRYRRPGSGWGFLGLLILALIGAGTVGVFAFGKARRWLGVVTASPDLPRSRTTWLPLVKDDAVLVTFTLKPRGATVFFEGAPAPSNPLRVPRGDKALQVTVFAPGFEPQDVTFVPDQARTVTVALKPRAEVASPGSPPATPH